VIKDDVYGERGPTAMSFQDDLAGVLVRDPRYTIEAYAFVLEALEYTRTLRKRPTGGRRVASRTTLPSRHVTGRDLCNGARRLALEQYGMLALPILRLWGINTTSDIGEIVYNLIESGDLEKTASDARADFDGVYDFENAFRRNFVLEMDDVA
jgi:uncharacterized repeat protein (TIGR04138 family)